MKSILIYNPKSGKGKILKYLDYIKSELSKFYDYLDVHESRSANDITEVVKASSKVYDRIIIAGGDGTFNNAAQGLSSCAKRPPLGFIAVGTCCDIAGNLGIPKKIKKAVEVIKKDHLVYHDVGMINDTYFMYVVAIGACTATPYTTKQDAKRIIGRLAYVKDGLDEFFNTPLSNVCMKCNGMEVKEKVPLLLVMNTYSVGGIKFNKNSTLNDGNFDVVLIHNGKGKGRLNILGYFIAGLLGFKRKPNALTLSSSRVEIEIDNDSVWCVDGERGPSGSVEIINLHNHLRIIAPNKE